MWRNFLTLIEILLGLSDKYKVIQVGHRSAIVKQCPSILSCANIPCTPINIRDTIIYNIKNHDAPCLSEAIYYCNPLRGSMIFYHRNDMLIYANLVQW